MFAVKFSAFKCVLSCFLRIKRVDLSVSVDLFFCLGLCVVLCLVLLH